MPTTGDWGPNFLCLRGWILKECCVSDVFRWTNFCTGEYPAPKYCFFLFARGLEQHLDHQDVGQNWLVDAQSVSEYPSVSNVCISIYIYIIQLYLEHPSVLFGDLRHETHFLGSQPYI